jgi:hypothetical protein
MIPRYMYSIAHNREYLREFETEFENILGYYSGALGQLIYEKTRGRKSRETVSLTLCTRVRKFNRMSGKFTTGIQNTFLLHMYLLNNLP